MKKIIPVVFSTMDDDYIYYLYVAMFSILRNSQKNVFYDFYILVPNDFSELSKKKIQYLNSIFYNSKISFINVGEAFKDTLQVHKHVKYPTYYRLLIPTIVCKYDKCIYLDSDTIICSDLNEMYEVDISNEYVAGVRAAAYMMNESVVRDNCSRLKIADVLNYFNAGVLLLNLKKMREDGIVSRFLSLLQCNFRDQDQDILNVACYGKVKILPFKYNMMTKYESIFDQCIQAQAYTQEEITEAIKNPIIIHYADKIKPWQNPDVYFGEIWWSYARQTSFYERILFFNMKKYLLEQLDVQAITKQNLLSKDVIDKFGVRELILHSLKDFTYYRYKFLSKILVGKKRLKYEKKYQKLKQIIKSIKK